MKHRLRHIRRKASETVVRTKPSAPKRTPSSSQTFTNPEKTTLASGIRVVSEQIPSAQSFALGAWIDVGSCDEMPQEYGITHFIEHLVFRGTASPERKRSSVQIANVLESVGGYLNAFTTKDHTCYYVRALDAHLVRSLELLADMCQHPIFREADVEKERKIIIEEMKSLEDEPEEMINDYLDELLFGKGKKAHPYAHPISGTTETMNAINREDIAQFHQRHYTPERMIIAASGNIDHKWLVAQIEQAFASSPKAKMTAKARVKAQVQSAHRSISPPKRRTAATYETTMPTQQMHFSQAALVPEMSDRDYYTLSALNIILGDGMSSRLNQVVREKHGLCYSIYSAISEIRQSVIFSIYAGFEPQQREKIRKLIHKELRRIAEEPVSKTELRRAKEQLKSSLIMGLESLSGRMTLLAKSELYLGRFESVEEKVAAIESVSAQDILDLAHKYLREEDWHTVCIAPEES